MLLAVDLCLKGEDRPMVDVGRIPRFVLAVLLLLALLQRGYSRFSKRRERRRAKAHLYGRDNFLALDSLCCTISSSSGILQGSFSSCCSFLRCVLPGHFRRRFKGCEKDEEESRRSRNFGDFESGRELEARDSQGGL